ncbi:MAG TPA: hypothetical protein VFK33_06560 [Bacillales bacterium]|nr:hypothetical protein [Bacillales bacterium]
MTININFQTITATTISGGGIFLGQNVALGWDAFTKSNTGISNGNHSPITNTLVIVDDRDVIDSPVIDADHPVAKVEADPPDNDPSLGSRRVVRKNSEDGNNNQLVIKRDGERVYPGENGPATDVETENRETASDPSETNDFGMNAEAVDVKKVPSRHDVQALNNKNPRKILFDL